MSISNLTLDELYDLESETAMLVGSRTNVYLEPNEKVSAAAGSNQESVDALLKKIRKLQDLLHFAGGTAHDLNNSFAVVISSLQVITEHGADPQTSKHFFEELLMSVRRAAKHVRELAKIEYALYESDPERPNPELTEEQTVFHSVLLIEPDTSEKELFRRALRLDQRVQNIFDANNVEEAVKILSDSNNKIHKIYAGTNGVDDESAHIKKALAAISNSVPIVFVKEARSELAAQKSLSSYPDLWWKKVETILNQQKLGD